MRMSDLVTLDIPIQVPPGGWGRLAFARPRCYVDQRRHVIHCHGMHSSPQSPERFLVPLPAGRVNPATKKERERIRAWHAQTCLAFGYRFQNILWLYVQYTSHLAT